ncbi:MAG: phosphate transport system regulatory protein PhoU [Candidatus Dadabacteria bacterium]|nr:MAG: phosphate transport system regulatory protein PhoU [Candidatus Dadabacteria bacterium]
MPPHLEKAISNLNKALLQLSSQVREAVEKSVEAVLKKDEQLAKKIHAGDKEIDNKEVELEEECLKILALHQPVAKDLRYLIAALKINNDLERIGDLAANIASRAVAISKYPSVPLPINLEKMCEKVVNMLNNSLESLIELDKEKAEKVLADDEEVDNLHRQMFKHIQGELKKDPDKAELYVLYLSVSRHLERIADLATNIAEDVIYLLTGKIVRHQE